MWGMTHVSAVGMERLSAEYLTLASAAQAERWDGLLTRSGLRDEDLAAVRTGGCHGPLLAAFREADARGLDIETAFPQLVAGRSLADAGDVAAALHSRVERWSPEPRASAIPTWPVVSLSEISLWNSAPAP
jgi:hypothetical protein